MPIHVLALLVTVVIVAGSLTAWAFTLGGSGFIALALPAAMIATVALRARHK